MYLNVLMNEFDFVQLKPKVSNIKNSRTQCYLNQHKKRSSRIIKLIRHKKIISF